jgi:hypothetical protein
MVTEISAWQPGRIESVSAKRIVTPRPGFILMDFEEKDRCFGYFCIGC